MTFRLEEKDYMRAVELGAKGSSVSNASKMARLIRDTEKLVRRSCAIAAVWGKGSDEFLQFKHRLGEFGFTEQQIEEISNYGQAN